MDYGGILLILQIFKKPMQYDNGRWGWITSIPPVTRHLLIINVLLWVVEFFFHSFSNTLIDRLGLHLIGESLFNPIQLVTYMFLHAPGTVWHMAFNMFTLWMFGPILERTWGSKRFLIFYFVCGIGAALIQEGVWALTWEHDYVAAIAPQNGMTYDGMRAVVDNALARGDAGFLASTASFRNHLVTIGASGAIFGLLLGFAFVFPDMPLYIFFIPIPVKAKYMVIGYAVIEFFLGVGGRLDTVAHFAHLGGMIFGLVLLLYWKKKGTLHGPGFH